MNKPNTFILWNDKIIKASDFYISPFSFALHYGLGLFETLLYKNEKIYFFAEHINRLTKSATYYRFNISHLNEEKLAINLRKLIEKNHLNKKQRIKLKLILFQEEKLAINKNTTQACQVTLLALAEPMLAEPMLEHVNSIALTSYQFKWHQKKDNIPPTVVENEMPISSSIKKHKTCNVLETWSRFNYHWQRGTDTFFYNVNKKIVECGFANLGVIKKNILYVVDANENILLGITQQMIVSRSQNLFKKIIHQKGFRLNELKKATAVLYLNSLRGVVSVRTIDNTALEISQQTKALIKNLNALLE